MTTTTPERDDGGPAYLITVLRQIASLFPNRGGKRRIRTSVQAQARRAAMMGRCSGWENPEERCPRAPEDCVCWDYEDSTGPARRTGGAA